MIDPLNAQQRAAVESEADRILILAGAGSGKTRTLTHRVARLVERGVAPQRIVLVTFTNRAAREMIARIESLLGPAARRVRAGTFHSFAFRCLRRHPEAVGHRPGFSIIDRQDQAELLSTLLPELGIDPHARRLPRADTLIRMFSGAINLAMTLEAFVRRDYPAWTDLAAQLEAAAALYARKKRSMNLMDFDDLLVHLHRLLENDVEATTEITNSIDHVLVDEFQDSNRLQAEITESLAADSAHVCVVGDDAQSIYAFRGARFENILEFPTVRPTEVHLLTHCYRCTTPILRVANAALAKNELQFPKTLVAAGPAQRAEQIAPVVVPCRDDRQQATFVAQRILELRDEGVSLGEQAVLYRAHTHGMALQLELARRQVPFVVRSGRRFLEQAHIRDFLAVFRILHNAHDELGWRRALSLLPGVGSQTTLWVVETLESARTEGSDPFLAFGEALATRKLPSRAQKGLAALHLLLDRTRAQCASGRHGEAATEVITFLAPYLDRFDRPERRREELEQLGFLLGQSNGIGTFINELALTHEGAAAETLGEDDGDDEDRVVLSSVHQAKGLEWRVVFIIHLADGAFPLESATAELSGEEEERRLFYVAVTRAARDLYLSHPAYGARGDGRAFYRPSRFVAEIPTDLYEEWVLQEPESLEAP